MLVILLLIKACRNVPIRYLHIHYSVNISSVCFCFLLVSTFYSSLCLNVVGFNSWKVNMPCNSVFILPFSESFYCCGWGLLLLVFLVSSLWLCYLVFPRVWLIFLKQLLDLIIIILIFILGKLPNMAESTSSILIWNSF